MQVGIISFVIKKSPGVTAVFLFYCGDKAPRYTMAWANKVNRPPLYPAAPPTLVIWVIFGLQVGIIAFVIKKPPGVTAVFLFYCGGKAPRYTMAWANKVNRPQL